MPGLLAKEKKWALIFIGTATPLFALGVATAYFVLPKAIAVLLSFTAEGVTNLQNINTFLSFMLRLMVVFGIAYLIPLLVLMLNIVGVVKARQLAKYRTLVIFGTFVFGAVATPSTDPFSMLALALPMTVLFLAAEVIAHILDRRKSRRIGQGRWSNTASAGDRTLRELTDPDRVRAGEPDDPAGRQPVVGQGPGPGAAARRGGHPARRRPRPADPAQPGLRRGAGDGQRAVADGVDVLAVMGGDGMMHLGVNVCAAAHPAGDRRTTLGLVPAGTGNDLCRGLGMDPKDAEAGARVIAQRAEPAGGPDPGRRPVRRRPCWPPGSTRW